MEPKLIKASNCSLQVELLAATRSHDRLPYVLAPTADALRGELAAGRPVLVLQNFGLAHWPIWHYAVVIGFDPDGDKFILRSGTTRRQTLAARRFLGTWRRAGNWAMVALRPAEVPPDATPARYLEAVAALSIVGRKDAAATAYEAALSRWLAEPMVWFALGNLRLAQNRAAEAEEAFRAALQRSPTDAAARNNLALLLSRRGCHASALVEIRRASRAAQNSPLAAEINDSIREIEAQTGAGEGPAGGSDHYPAPMPEPGGP